MEAILKELIALRVPVGCALAFGRSLTIAAEAAPNIADMQQRLHDEQVTMLVTQNRNGGVR